MKMNQVTSILSDPVVSDSRILLDPTLSDIGYPRLPIIGILSDPTVGKCRIFPDPIGSYGAVSTWVRIKNEIREKR